MHYESRSMKWWKCREALLIAQVLAPNNNNNTAFESLPQTGRHTRAHTFYSLYTSHLKRFTLHAPRVILGKPGHLVPDTNREARSGSSLFHTSSCAQQRHRFRDDAPDRTTHALAHISIIHHKHHIPTALRSTPYENIARQIWTRTFLVPGRTWER